MKIKDKDITIVGDKSIDVYIEGFDKPKKVNNESIIELEKEPDHIYAEQRSI